MLKYVNAFKWAYNDLRVYLKQFIKINMYNFLKLQTDRTKLISLSGLFLLFSIVHQNISGLLLAFSYIPEPFITPTSRDNEDLDNKTSDDFFNSHERGVDIIFIFMVMHLLRKFFLGAYTKNQEVAWKTGSFLFLLIHGSIFFGLVLCCTHLSDITLTIAANIVNTIFLKFGKAYWFLFTDQTLNADTLNRCALIHYGISITCLFLGILHALLMHYDYKDNNQNNDSLVEYEWFDFIIKKEIYLYIVLILFLTYFSEKNYTNVEPLSFEIFMWGDVGMNTDMRFLSVAPHWYFRSYMGWLLLCPHHYIGIYGMIFFLIIIYFQVIIKFIIKFIFDKKSTINSIPEFSQTLWIIFISLLMSIFYTNTTLPYGRFYNRILGNPALIVAYVYVFYYLSSNIYRYINRLYNNSYTFCKK